MRWRISLVAVRTILVVAALQALEGGTASGGQATAETKVLHFPKDRCLGMVRVLLDLDSAVPDPYTLALPLPLDTAEGPSAYVGLAQGDLLSPKDAKLVLSASEHSSPLNLRGLHRLDPNDLYSVLVDSWTNGVGVDDRILAPLSHLTGLRVLTFGSNVGVLGKASRYLNQLRGLRALDLGSPVSDADLAELYLPELEYLNCGQWIGDAGIRTLRHFPKLRWLRLRTGTFAGPGLAELSRLPCLDSLCLWGSPGPTDDQISHIQGLTHLKRLTVWGSRDLTDVSLQYIGRLTNLEELTFIKVTGLTDEGVAHLRNLTSLKRIDFGPYLVIGDRGIKYLTGLPQLEAIRHVHATSEGIRALASFPHLKVLSVQWMGPSKDPGLHSQGSVNLKLGLEGEVVAAGVKELAKLKSLDELDLCWSTDYGHEDDIRFLEALTDLKRLTLSTTKFLTGTQVDAISKLKNLEFLLLRCGTTAKTDLNKLNGLVNLTSLDIRSYRGLNPDGSTLYLSGLKNLKTLRLGLPGLEDADLACLAGLSHLQTLSVYGAFSEQDLRYFKDMTELRDLQIGKISMPTGEGVAFLSGLRNLGRVALTGRVTDAAVNRLAGLPPSVWSLRITTDEPIQGRSIAHVEQGLPILGYEHPHGMTIEKMPHRQSRDEFLSEYYKNTRNQPVKIRTNVSSGR